jgi:uncharacterized PurR-regulated membrane protein YhhQ (DUF165 family)
MIVGSFLSWMKATAPFVGTLSKSGVDGGSDGWISVGLGIVIIASTIRYRRTHKLAIWGIALPGALCGVLVIFELADISRRFADVKAQTDLVATSYGPGLIVIAAAAIAAFICGLTLRQQE